MIVVLEGPDCAGKTTLAQRLAESRRASVIVTNGPPPDGVALLDHYSSQITRAIASPNRLTVFDRLHAGELIYGPLFRGQSGLSADDVKLLEQQLDTAGAIKLHIDCSDDTLRARFESRGDKFVNNADQLLHIAQLYRTMCNPTGILRGWRHVATDGQSVDVEELISS